MDLEPFHRTVYQGLVFAASAINSALPIVGAQAVPLPSSQNANIVSYQNVTSQNTFTLSSSTYHLNTNLNINNNNSGLMLVGTQKEEKEEEVKESIDVPEPVPSVKSSPLPEKLAEDESVASKASDLAPAITKEVTKLVEKVESTTQNFFDLLPLSPLPVGSLSAEALFQLVNKHRSERGLTNLEKDERLCKLAQYRAPQLHNEVFGSGGSIHHGFRALKLPYWITENAAAYSSELENFKFWLSDSIHRGAVEGDYKYTCVACAGNACVQEFSSFAPK